MVNNIIVNYLRDNIDDYELDSLVEKLIKSGYSQEEINLAIHYLKLNKKSSKKYKIQKKK